MITAEPVPTVVILPFASTMATLVLLLVNVTVPVCDEEYEILLLSPAVISIDIGFATMSGTFRSPVTVTFELTVAPVPEWVA